MATFPKPSEILKQYKDSLKSLRPDINVEDISSEPIIRGKVSTGIVSGLYSDQKKVDNDGFITDARPEGLARHGGDYNLPSQPAVPAKNGAVPFTGDPGAVLEAGSIARLELTGVQYSLDADVILDGLGEGTGAITATVPGQVGNFKAPVEGISLTLLSPPPGIDVAVTLLTDIADGSGEETVDSYRARLLNRRQHPPAGGNKFDYPQFGFEASDAVRKVSIVRHGRGLGTVDVYITSGTTDIDAAVTAGIPVVRVPGQPLIDAVQAYYDDNVPLTDCPRIFAPVEVAQAVTVYYRLATGVNLTTVPDNALLNPEALNVGQLINREVGRVLYLLLAGGRKIPGRPGGYVVAADIEAQLDRMLSAVPDQSGLPIGKIPVLMDRQVGNLDGANVDRLLAGNELVIPGAITKIVGP